MQISLSGDFFVLTLPSGRELQVSVDQPRALARILRDAASDAPAPRGYIGVFPTQAIVDSWLSARNVQLESERAERQLADAASAREAFISKYGFAPEEVDF